jgi:hypothetical protein
MEHLGDLGHVKSHFGPIGESCILGARLVHGLRRAYNRLVNCFGCTQRNSMVMCVMSNLISVRLQMVIVSVHNRSTVHAKYTIGLEIILDTPDGTPR